ncbi:MAG: hypothetical protein IKY27_08535 [Bacteroidales bacterium]|nr:hypothetical protein [Bacteroidales bacterium]
MKKLNYYYGMDACMALFVVLLFCKNIKGSWAVATVVAFALLFVLAYTSKAKVNNESEEAVKAKPEDACEPLLDVAPGAEHYGFDGIKANGKVFKAANGTHIVVKKDGSVKTKALTGKMVNAIRGGVLASPPDSCWNKLFDC